MNEDTMKLMEKIEGKSFEEVRKTLRNTSVFQFATWEKYGKKRIYVSEKAKKNFNQVFYMELTGSNWFVSEPKNWNAANTVSEMF